LAEPDSSATVIVCLGRNYLDAVVTDLVALVERLSDPERVIIFASGTPLVDLEDCWVTVPASLRLAVGGSLSSTNIRAAMAVLADLGRSTPIAHQARIIVGKLAATTGELPSLKRCRHDDKAISEWMFDHLVDFPATSKTSALQRFRDEGNACEQIRFGRLFDEAYELMN